MANWKQLEYRIRDILIKHGLPAVRQLRDRYESKDDVRIEGQSWVKIDGKYSEKGFAVNRMWDKAAELYATEKGDEMILVTRGYKEQPQATVNFDFLARLLAHYINGGGTPPPLKERVEDLVYSKTAPGGLEPTLTTLNEVIREMPRFDDPVQDIILIKLQGYLQECATLAGVLAKEVSKDG